MAAARNALASMLDELMGKHRNTLPSERPPDAGFKDPDVCHYFLSGFCHHELFTNTKADLGPCGKFHDEKLRDQYQSSNEIGKIGFEDEWLDALQRVNNDMQKKIKRNKQRLELTQPGGNVENANKNAIEAKVDSLSEKITALLLQAETLGAQGQVEEAQKLIKKTEDLKEERDDCQKAIDKPVSEQKLMEVCDTCGCFLIVGDCQHRIDEHLTGKQHLGFAKIRATIDELLRKKEENLRKRDEEMRRDLDDRDRKRRGDSRSSRHHSHRRSRSRDRRDPRSNTGHHRYTDDDRRSSRRSDDRYSSGKSSSARRSRSGDRRQSSRNEEKRPSSSRKHSDNHHHRRSSDSSRKRRSRSRSRHTENRKTTSADHETKRSGDDSKTTNSSGDHMGSVIPDDKVNGSSALRIVMAPADDASGDNGRQMDE